jgi:hypothetical protein
MAPENLGGGKSHGRVEVDLKMVGQPLLLDPFPEIIEQFLGSLQGA